MIYSSLDDLVAHEVAPALVGTGIDAARVGRVLRDRDLIVWRPDHPGLELVTDDEGLTPGVLGCRASGRRRGPGMTECLPYLLALVGPLAVAWFIVRVVRTSRED